MSAQLLACPLCSQPGFSSLDSLRDSLILAATCQLMCPICSDILLGLDKFTIHLFSHCTQKSAKLDSKVSKKTDFNQTSCPNITNMLDTNECLDTREQSDSSLLENLQCSLSYNVADQHIDSTSIDSPTIAQTHSKILTMTDDVPGKSKKSCSFNNPLGEQKADIGGCETQHTLTEANLVKPQESFRSKENSLLTTEHIFESCGLVQTELGLQSNHLVQSEESRCNFCGVSFNDPSVLLMHKQLVHNHFNDSNSSNSSEEKNFGCFLCSKVFKMRGSLMVHLRVVHGGSNVGGNNVTINSDVERPVVCNTCGKSFTKEQHLSQHMKTHEEKQWECDVCQKMFTTKYFLKKHKRLHTGEMPYSCNICHKAFTFQQSMHKHALYHSNDKPHSCPDCHRTFKELSTLTNHRRIHTGEKPFSCETCGKCFRQRVSYLVHRRIHTGAMPYQCTACGKSFRYKVSERTHKCPSQPPGTIVRQAGELLQKLQEKAAAQAKLIGDANQQIRQPVSHFLDQQQTTSQQHGNYVSQPCTGQVPSDLTHQQRAAQVSSVSSQQQRLTHVTHPRRGSPQHKVGVPQVTSGATPTRSSCLEQTSSCLLHQVDNLSGIEAQTLTSACQQQFQGNQFIIILDNSLQSTPNLIANTSVVNMSSQTLQSSSLMPTVLNENLWCQQSSISSQKAGEDTIPVRSVALSKICQWPDTNMDMNIACKRKGKTEIVKESISREKGKHCELFQKCKKLELKSLEIDLSETPDFFSVLENLPSPSERLRNLTISPSIQHSTKPSHHNSDANNFPLESTSNFTPTNNNHPSESNPLLSNKNQEILQTINEESLKQLLYGSPSDDS